MLTHEQTNALLTSLFQRSMLLLLAVGTTSDSVVWPC